MSNGIVDLTVSNSSPSDDDSSALQIAIDEAQSNRLRDTLRRLCRDSKDTARAAQAILLVPLDRSKPRTTRAAEEGDEDMGEKGEDTEESESDSSSKDEAAAAEAAEANWSTVHELKRHRPGYVTCMNCEEEFDITQNESGDCVYHPGADRAGRLMGCIGESEVDRDASIWDDHDEDTHGEIDTEDMRNMHPEGFIYDCCDENGASKGCKTSRHIEKIVYPSKRLRY
ncbi:MAG: hypothetical protein Q9226_002652 [Calogaya cf. arnoldii]